MTDNIHTRPGGLEACLGSIAGSIDAQKGEEIIVLDLRSICDFTDAFVITTARSSTHMQSLVKHLLGELRKLGLRPLGKPETAGVRWVLLDFGEIIIHLFDAEARTYYDLETLWGDAEQLPWRELAMA